MQDDQHRHNVLWMGEIQPWMTDQWVFQTYFGNDPEANQISDLRLIRDKNTGQLAGYGFVHFHTHEAAASVLQRLANTQVPGTSLQYRLKWGLQRGPRDSGANREGGAGGGRGMRMPSRSPARDLGGEVSLFMPEVPRLCTEAELLDLFKKHYPSVHAVKLVTKEETSKTFAFIRFGDEKEAEGALREMNGQIWRGMSIRLDRSRQKRDSTGERFSVGAGGDGGMGGGAFGGLSQGSYGNTTAGDWGQTVSLFVGGVGRDADAIPRDELLMLFQQTGASVVSVDVVAAKGIAFVHVGDYQSAERAISQLNGFAFKNMRLKVSYRTGDRERDTQAYGQMGGMGGTADGGAFAYGGAQQQQMVPQSMGGMGMGMDMSGDVYGGGDPAVAQQMQFVHQMAMVLIQMGWDPATVQAVAMGGGDPATAMAQMQMMLSVGYVGQGGERGALEVCPPGTEEEELHSVPLLRGEERALRDLGGSGEKARALAEAFGMDGLQDTHSRLSVILSGGMHPPPSVAAEAAGIAPPGPSTGLWADPYSGARFCFPHATGLAASAEADNAVLVDSQMEGLLTGFISYSY
uniref:RRM domain-containing protein n=1 Tax=Chromera velia CCMP2878 TaxID=1169474 RepID=A0A0G4HCY1_9ALVE|eukprot:Cvel_6371.t1-p1 / transcript=Cvel_6371.t1 / gene=Cvel_6371 / organism=Chromera_velia_CCMP2878 / gene_product=Polyadenylate-binding protein RBP47, putative / transcript_product=Polyadenylate-binding protein RBP47, putative / location=Cvel_scaffold310:21364-24638(-) / protein_length=574 / sequence_SO=supercontig / SO=protein_coding / is_pseudo=false